MIMWEHAVACSLLSQTLYVYHYIDYDYDYGKRHSLYTQSKFIQKYDLNEINFSIHASVSKCSSYHTLLYNIRTIHATICVLTYSQWFWCQTIIKAFYIEALHFDCIFT